MRYERLLLLITVGLVLVLTVSVRAQNSPYTRPEDNLGSWSWDKPASRNNDDGEEHEPGETSWERMQAERQPEVGTTPQREILKSLSPLSLWRWWRGEKKPDQEKTEDIGEE